MMWKRMIWIGVAALSLPVSGAWAQLAWDTVVVEAEPTGERWVEAVFPFSNTGTYPLTIKRVTTDNRRAEATVSGKTPTIRRREARQVVVRYRNSGVVEPVDVTIKVATDEQQTEPTMLTLSLLPRGTQEKRREQAKARASREAWRPPYEIEPAALRWDVGGEAGPQTITIKAREGQRLPKVLELADVFPGRDGLFNVQKVYDEATETWRVTVTPAAVERRALAMLGVGGWSDEALSADPLLGDRGLRLRWSLRLLVSPKRVAEPAEKASVREEESEDSSK